MPRTNAAKISHTYIAATGITTPKKLDLNAVTKVKLSDAIELPHKNSIVRTAKQKIHGCE